MVFTDTFQGAYKNETNGTRDCRWFAVIYPSTRILSYIIKILYALTLSSFSYHRVGRLECRDSTDARNIHDNTKRSPQISITVSSVSVYNNVPSIFECFHDQQLRPIVTRKSITKVPNQKAAKLSKCFSFFFLLKTG